MFDALPNLHPALVHFPIALLVTAIAADLAAVVTPRRDPLRPAVTVLHLAGTVSLVATYLTGRSAALTVFTPGMAHSAVESHWNLALVMTIYFGILAVARLWASWTLHEARWKLWGVLLLAGLAGLVGLAETASRGGLLVYRWGVGVMGP